MRISDWSSDVCSSDLAEDDIVDALGVDAAFLDKRADHGGAEIARGERRERAAEFSDGGPDGRDDRYAAQFHKYWLPGFYRSEEHTSELQSLMRISYAVFCLKKKYTQQKS